MSKGQIWIRRMIDIDDSAFQGKVEQTHGDIVTKLAALEYIVGDVYYRLYEESADFDPDSQLSVSKEGARMLAHVGLEDYRIIVTFLPEDYDTAGHIELNQMDSQEVFINIDDDHKGSRVAVLCILAHEISHKILQTKRFTAPTREINEVYTDLTAIYCGFGRQILNGCFEKKYNLQKVGGEFRTVLSTQSIGYLRIKDYAFAYRLMCEFYGIGEKAYKSGLDAESLEAIAGINIPGISQGDLHKKILSHRQECASLLRKIYLLEDRMSSYKSSIQYRLKQLDLENDIIGQDGSIAKPVTAYSLMAESPLAQMHKGLDRFVELLEGKRDIRKINKIFCPYCLSEVKVPAGLETEGYTNFECFSCGKKFMVALTEEVPDIMPSETESQRNGLLARMLAKLRRKSSG